MVQRLNAAQTFQIILDLPEACELRIPEPIDLDWIAANCAAMVEQPSGRAFGFFDDTLTPHGILVGGIMPDPFTRKLAGFEHIWWVDKAWRGKAAMPLMRAFEAECKKAGCVKVSFGFSTYVEGSRMEKMYKRLGYEPSLVTVTKVM